MRRARRAGCLAGTTPVGESAATRARPEPTPRSGGLLLARRAHLVADPPDGHDRGRVAELAAELTDVHVDRARVARERVPPDALEQLVAREHEAPMVEQLPEEIELLRRQLDLLIAHARFTPSGIDGEVAVLDDGTLTLRALRGCATQDRPHARDKLPRVERLRHVVVGADLEPDDLVDVFVARRQHQDR